MKTPIPAPTRRRLFIATNSLVRAALKSATRPDLQSALADLASARAQLDDLTECLNHQTPKKET